MHTSLESLTLMTKQLQFGERMTENLWIGFQTEMAASLVLFFLGQNLAENQP